MLKKLAETIKAYKLEGFNASSVSKSEMSKRGSSHHISLHNVVVNERQIKTVQRAKSFFIEDEYVVRSDFVSSKPSNHHSSSPIDFPIVESPLENFEELKEDSPTFYEDAIQNEPEPESSKDDPEIELFEL